jgi:phenylacetate-coenzyme A ligase PaaK-like adenylate-forming protein
MFDKALFKNTIFNVSPLNFNEKALELFQYQAQNNEIYQSYLQYLKVNPDEISNYTEMPFLPIDFFKKHVILTGTNTSQTYFSSSGTTGQVRSKHYVEDLKFYEDISRHIFEHSFGLLKDTVILALLPSYQENPHSSLIYMIDSFMKVSKTGSAYIRPGKEGVDVIKEHIGNNENVVLFGVTYALLDLAEQFPSDFHQIKIIETGGMKGRRKEITREEFHETLKSRLKLDMVCSEYGMSELLSQAYSVTTDEYTSPPWMKVLTRELNDPFTSNTGKGSGGVNVIDLANVHSCAFIETRDIGIVTSENTFKILGRIDNSDLRGCSLLML